MHPPFLGTKLVFPPAERADEDGVVAIGGDLSIERLLLAYSSGIFPWPVQNIEPVLWFSPDPRWVIEPPKAHVPRSLRKQMRRGLYEVRADTAFAQVINGCAESSRRGQDSTWITFEMEDAYNALHAAGYAHSIEAWREGELVGGLYGVSLGGVFFGESMFAAAPDASKVAFATLLGNLVRWGFDLVDCQTKTEHLLRFGSVAVARKDFLATVKRSLANPTKRGRWTLDVGPEEAESILAG